MADPIRIGVIGVGMIGKHHLNEYAKIPDAKVVAVADVNEAEAQRVAGEYKIPNAYGDFRKLLASKEIDAVDVCLHNNLHAPVTIEALNAGKNVYCEKPMSGAYADSKAMYDAAKKTGKLLHIQLSTLYTIEHKTAKRLITEGHLGNIYYGRAFGFRRRGRPWVDGYGTPSFVQKQNSGGEGRIAEDRLQELRHKKHRAKQTERKQGQSNICACEGGIAEQMQRQHRVFCA